VVLAPLAWVVAEAVGYVVAARLCEPATDLAMSSQALHARVANSIVCGVCLVVALVGLSAAIKSTRGASGMGGRVRFLAIGGAFTSAVFAAAIVLFAVPGLILNVCSQAH
jgi:hypothetical protein